MINYTQPSIQIPQEIPISKILNENSRNDEDVIINLLKTSSEGLSEYTSSYFCLEKRAKKFLKENPTCVKLKRFLDNMSPNSTDCDSSDSDNNEKMPTVDVTDVSGIMDSERNCGLCPSRIASKKRHRHLKDVHKVCAKKVSFVLSNLKITKVKQVKCSICGVMSTHLGRHIEDVHKKSKEEVNKIKSDAVRATCEPILSKWNNKVDEFEKYIKDICQYRNMTKFEKNSRFKNCIRMAKMLYPKQHLLHRKR